MIDRHEAWVKALKKTGLPKNKIKFLTVCSDHFQTGRPVDDLSHPDYVPNQKMDQRPQRMIHKPQLTKIEIKEEEEELQEVNLEAIKVTVEPEPEPVAKKTPRRRPKKKKASEEPNKKLAAGGRKRIPQKKTPEKTTTVGESLTEAELLQFQSILKPKCGKVDDQPLDLEEMRYHHELISMGLEPISSKKWKNRKLKIEYVRKYDPSTGETTDSASETEEMTYWYDRNIIEKPVIELMQEHNYCEKLEIETSLFRRKILAMDHVDLDYLSDDSSVESLFKQDVEREDPLNVPNANPIAPIIKNEGVTDHCESDSEFLLEDYPEPEEICTKIEFDDVAWDLVEIKFEVKTEDNI